MDSRQDLSGLSVAEIETAAIKLNNKTADKINYQLSTH